MTLDFTRRSALHVLGAGASLGAGVGASIGALAKSSAANTALSDFESFAQSSRKNPWTLGWRSVPASDMSTAKLRVDYERENFGRKLGYVKTGFSYVNGRELPFVIRERHRFSLAQREIIGIVIHEAPKQSAMWKYEKTDQSFKANGGDMPHRRHNPERTCALRHPHP